MASCHCHNLWAQDCCLAAQGAFVSPLTIPILWGSESGGPTKAKRCEPYQGSLLPMKDSRGSNRVQRNVAWPSCWRIQRGVPSDGREKDKDEVIQKESAFVLARPHCAPLPAAGQAGREALTWPPVRREHVRTCWGLGMEQIPKSEKHCDWASCNLVPTGLGLCRTLTDAELLDNRKVENGREWGVWWVMRRVCEVSPSHRAFY